MILKNILWKIQCAMVSYFIAIVRVLVAPGFKYNFEDNNGSINLNRQRTPSVSIKFYNYRNQGSF